MSSLTKAVIDVGTNSVKLLVAEVSGGHVVPILETSLQTRLGKGLYEHHILQNGAIANTAAAVRGFFETARELGPETIRVLATSAARDAKNVGELVRSIHESCGLDLEVISGDEEADLVYRGVQSGTGDDEGAVMIVDVGGGSTEIIIGHGERPGFHRSYRVGTVRLMERFPPSDPPTTTELAEVRECLRKIIDEFVRPDLEKVTAPGERSKFIGTGGTTALLARMQNQSEWFDRDKIESTVLTAEMLNGWVNKLWSMNLSERKTIVGLPPEKADVILLGVAIFDAILNASACDEIHVSLSGLRFGALLPPGKE